jgi:hypothetical protein
MYQEFSIIEFCFSNQMSNVKDRFFKSKYFVNLILLKI